MAKAQAPPDVRHLLVGNKSNIEGREVGFDIGEAKCEELRMTVYIESSTRDECEALVAALRRFPSETALRRIRWRRS